MWESNKPAARVEKIVDKYLNYNHTSKLYGLGVKWFFMAPES